MLNFRPGRNFTIVHPQFNMRTLVSRYPTMQIFSGAMAAASNAG
jgi:hypothetical protein